MNLADLSSAQLKRAVQIKEQIEKLQSQLSTLLGETNRSSGTSRPVINGKKPALAQTKKPKAKRTMSAAARARIAASAKARWAKAKAAGKKSL